MWNVERTLRWDLSLHSQHLGGCWDVFQCNVGFVSYRMQSKIQIAGVRFTPGLIFLCLFRLFLGVSYSLKEYASGGGFDVRCGCDRAVCYFGRLESHFLWKFEFVFLLLGRSGT